MRKIHIYHEADKKNKLQKRIEESFIRVFNNLEGYVYVNLVIVKELEGIPKSKQSPHGGFIKTYTDFQYGRLTVYIALEEVDKDTPDDVLDTYFTHEMVHALIDISKYCEENAVVQLTQMITDQDKMAYILP